MKGLGFEILWPKSMYETRTGTPHSEMSSAKCVSTFL